MKIGNVIPKKAKPSSRERHNKMKENNSEKKEIKIQNLISNDTADKGGFIDGFSKKTILGALFVAFIMMPGSIFLSLMAGQSLGTAAEWVTIILFAELAKRSFTRLKRQEIYILFFVANTIANSNPFSILIWTQYLLQSPQTSAISEQIPNWVVPPVTSPAVQTRNLIHPDWWWSASRGFLSPVIMVIFGYILGRLSWYGLGYVMFRVTSDHERLPFPLAPIAAEGSTALAESTEREEDADISKKKKSWRWNLFSIAASGGIIFGTLYILLPVFTGLFLKHPIMIFPIPFIDFTSNVEGVLPASLISLSIDIGAVFIGMIIPPEIAIGMFTATVLTSIIGNPILQHFGVFKHWTPGNGLLVNQMILSFDFWMSVSVGLSLGVAIIGILNIVNTIRKNRKKAKSDSPAQVSPDRLDRRPSKERGDFPIWVGVGLFFLTTCLIAWITHILVPDFPLWIMIVFGFVWSPINSYISARLIGLTGSGVGVPFLKETSFILSGYKGVDIWFAPMPLFDHGAAAQRFRELELTRTRFTSIFKAELFIFPIVLLSSFLFYWFFWHLTQIPSDSFPFIARTWPVAARQAYLIYTANSTEQPLLLQALNPKIIGGSLGVGLGIFSLLSLLGLPVIFFYGLIGGVGAPLHATLPIFIGVLLKKFYFNKKFGKETWAKYLPVIAAGFSCGIGLAGMIAVAMSLVSYCTRDLPF